MSSKSALTLGALDQAVVSLGSIIFLVAAAQGLSAEGLGVFALTLSTVLFVQSLTRSFIGDVLIVGKFSPTFRGGGEALSAVYIVIFVCVILFLILSASVIPMTEGLLGAAVAVAGVLLQDFFRYLHISRRDVGRLVVIDVCTVSFQSISILLTATLTHSPIYVAAAWGIPPLIAGIYSSINLREFPRFRRSFNWFRETWRDGLAYSSEATIGAMVGYAITVSLVLFQGEDSVALYRVILSVFGLTSLIMSFAKTTMVRELGRIGNDFSQIKRTFLLLITVMSTSVGMVALLILVIPGEIGVALFGSTWLMVIPLTSIAALNRLGATWSIVPSVFLRSMGATWAVSFIRLAIGVPALFIAPHFAAIYGVEGALVAETIVYFLIFLSLVMLLRIRVRAHG